MTTRTILNACVKMDNAGKEAVAYTRTINTLDPASRSTLMGMLTPAITSIGDLVQNGTVGIKDQTTKDTIQALLVGLQTTLAGIQLQIAGGV